MLGPDWAFEPLPFYQNVILATTVETGLYDHLQSGIDPDTLAERYTCEILSPVLDVLVELGWVIVTKTHQMVWAGPHPKRETLALVHHLRKWTGLSSRFPKVQVHEEHISDDYAERLQMSMLQLGPGLVDLLNPTPGSQWLDVGGGSGGLSLELARRGIQVTLVDLPEVVERSPHLLHRSLPKISVVATDILHFTSPARFDGIVMMRFIENFRAPDLVRLWRKLRNQLTPRGQLYVIGYIRRISPLSSLFSLNVILNGEGGKCYDTDELHDIARQADLSLDFCTTDGPAGYAIARLCPRSLPDEPWEQCSHLTDRAEPRYIEMRVTGE